MNTIAFCRLHPDGVIPDRHSESAAGLDLSSIEAGIVYPHERYVCRTGLSVRLPSCTYGRIAPRSGLAFHHGIDVLAGVIDADYRGEIKVILYNTGSEPYILSKGDRIAQLICERIAYPSVEVVDTLEETERGNGGFGSTDFNYYEIGQKNAQNYLSWRNC